MDGAKSAMSRADRDALLSLVRKREKVMKSAAEERSAAMLADFDGQLAKMWAWDEDATWEQAMASAEAAVNEANAKISARAQELGIPDEFAPRINFAWNPRYHSASQSRRQELRQAARSRIAAVEKEAHTKIERMSLEAQTDLLSQGLTNEGALKFLNDLASVEQLMPSLDIKQVAELIDARTRKRRDDPAGYLQ